MTLVSKDQQKNSLKMPSLVIRNATKTIRQIFTILKSYREIEALGDWGSLAVKNLMMHKWKAIVWIIYSQEHFFGGNAVKNIVLSAATSEFPNFIILKIQYFETWTLEMEKFFSNTVIPTRLQLIGELLNIRTISQLFQKGFKTLKDRYQKSKKKVFSAISRFERCRFRDCSIE